MKIIKQVKSISKANLNFRKWAELCKKKDEDEG